MIRLNQVKEEDVKRKSKVENKRGKGMENREKELKMIKTAGEN